MPAYYRDDSVPGEVKDTPAAVSLLLSGTRSWGLGFGVWDCRVLGLGFGFRVWGLGFGVWGLEKTFSFERSRPSQPLLDKVTCSKHHTHIPKPSILIPKPSRSLPR